MRPFIAPSDPSTATPGFSAWFALPFRPFFLAGAGFAVISILLWILIFSGQLQVSLYGGAYWWHMHEMLFGFSSAIVVGFLLTAVKNWTGQPGLKGWHLAGLFLLWLIPRILMSFPETVPGWLISSMDLAFLPVSTVLLLRPVVKVRRWRNLVFLPVLSVMVAANGAMHLAVAGGNSLTALQAAYLMVMMLAVLIAIMAGRVFPMFTANGTGTPRVENIAWLERTAIGSLLACAIVITFPDVVADVVAISLLLVSAVLNIWRALRWRPQVTLRTPLLWSLHLAYSFLPLSLILFALAVIDPSISRSLALHTLTVGTLGLMILSMISRVSLGHTGRMLRVDYPMVIAFLAIVLSVLFRVVGVLLLPDALLALVLSAGFWCLGFTLFVLRFWFYLSTPRPDGQAG